MYRKAVGIVALVVLFCTITAFSAELDEPLRLEDGSYLFIDEDGMMRMVDRSGRPIEMRSDVEMKTIDGDIIMMKQSCLAACRAARKEKTYV